MKYFPIFLNVQAKRILVAGGGETALAKLRLLLKTESILEVYATEPAQEIRAWAADGRVRLFEQDLTFEQVGDAIAIYAAYDCEDQNLQIANLGREAGVLVNVVDTPEYCDFITPSIVDRDPLVVAIGTEGAAPVLGRKIKAKLEAEISPEMGGIVKIAQKFRQHVAHFSSRKRREFWARFYDRVESADQAKDLLANLVQENYHQEGHVQFVGAGPGDPELLTLKARKAIDQADVILHDRLVSAEILELARREARLIEVGKKGFGPSWSQSDINALMIKEAQNGNRVVRLKSGDPVIYGRLDEETEALENEGIAFDVIPGVSAANAAAASLKLSLTRRERNSELRYLTGHDLNGFAEHDWRSLSKPGSCAAIYMGAAQASQLRGRLLMHGARPSTPITAIENVSRSDEKIILTNLLEFPEALEKAKLKGPVVILFGISRERIEAKEQIEFVEFAQ